MMKGTLLAQLVLVAPFPSLAKHLPGFDSQVPSTVASIARQKALMATSRRAAIASGALALLNIQAAVAFAPTDAAVYEQAAQFIECKVDGCKEAALEKLKPFLDVTDIEKNAKGKAAEHDLEVVKCVQIEESDEPDAPIHVKVKVVAESVDMMDYVAVIWLMNVSTGNVLAARAMHIEDEGAPTVKFDAFYTSEQLLRIKNDVLVPRLYCASHGLWEGSTFTLAQYLDNGGLDLHR